MERRRAFKTTVQVEGSYLTVVVSEEGLITIKKFGSRTGKTIPVLKLWNELGVRHALGLTGTDAPLAGPKPGDHVRDPETGKHRRYCPADLVRLLVKRKYADDDEIKRRGLQEKLRRLQPIFAEQGATWLVYLEGGSKPVLAHGETETFEEAQTAGQLASARIRERGDWWDGPTKDVGNISAPPDPGGVASG